MDHPSTYRDMTLMTLVFQINRKLGEGISIGTGVFFRLVSKMGVISVISVMFGNLRNLRT